MLVKGTSCVVCIPCCRHVFCRNRRSCCFKLKKICVHPDGPLQSCCKQCTVICIDPHSWCNMHRYTRVPMRPSGPAGSPSTPFGCHHKLTHVYSCRVHSELPPTVPGRKQSLPAHSHERASDAVNSCHTDFKCLKYFTTLVAAQVGYFVVEAGRTP